MRKFENENVKLKSSSCISVSTLAHQNIFPFHIY